MFLYKTHVFLIISLSSITVRAQDDELFSNLIDGGLTPMQNLKADLYEMENKEPEKVEIKLFYECLCPDCRVFDTTSLKPTVEKLAPYLNLRLYPYGNAETIEIRNGVYQFKCQHGPKECYGNKLHACVIDYMSNNTEAVFFNSCLMDSARKNNGSDDEAADECGRILGIYPGQIKYCAKHDRGMLLLKHYGDESKKAGFKYVPYILINGVENNGSKFMKDVCAAFKNPPAACAQAF
ncbi:GILT-like protein 2 isoform X3 [Spodoptera frugiperda]|uniref:GILT-like protein 2 isoform X2 n=1 Tax=Spodoptera frugiperda TaxID=7108 RepID=A0A9R0EXS8_SPOFR|nr:GILT-like protein 2 isoform X2 [Spodoptera frugiperda]XP_050555079.1 GILT-like protein 2 isoform X3 [Spodoptera frugiperda]